MRRAILLSALIATFSFAAQQPRKPRPAALEVLDLKVHREDGKVAVEGRVRNAGEKPVRRLVLLFNFLAPGNEVIARGRGPAEEETLKPGQEHSFNYQIPDHARAVWLRLSAEDTATGDEPKVINPGPYTIE